MLCYWPRTNISFRARKAEIPDNGKWAKYPVRILHYTGEHYTARTARFSKKSLGSDVGEIKKMSEKLKKKSVLTPRNV